MPPIYYVMLCIQRGLANAVVPQLRALTVDLDNKRHEILINFYIDGEITSKLRDLLSVAMIEVDTNTKVHYFTRDELFQLKSPEPIPVEGKLAYLRYETKLPEFKRENRSFLKDTPSDAIYRLDMQEALLGKVTPSLRHVGVNLDSDQKKLITRFTYDGKISELDFQLAQTAIQESRISFPEYEMVATIDRVDYPEDMAPWNGWLAFWRHEWDYDATSRMPAISPNQS